MPARTHRASAAALSVLVVFVCFVVQILSSSRFGALREITLAAFERAERPGLGIDKSMPQLFRH
jgi:hypothetical protein